MRTTDYNQGKSVDDIKEGDDNIEDLQQIANKKIADIKPDEYPNLLMFPRDWKLSADNVSGQEIFSLNDNKLETKNIMGFIGRNKTNLTITSRFIKDGSKDDADDYLLHYMLQKVMKINILDLGRSGDKKDIWNDLLIFLFPLFLNRALSQGLYKEYKRNEYNDANVRGVIDVKRHLCVNNPFSGKVAYSTREYSYDNPVMQIIRHTIEYIKTGKYNYVLTADHDTFSNVNQIIYATPRYNKNNRQNVIGVNQNKLVVHPYFTEYKALQRLCIRILSNEKISTNNEKEKIHGILFDGAWLWEEYLNTVLADKGFCHSNSKTGKNGYKLFANYSNKIYPDFIKKTEPIIADAKYKRIERYLGNRETDDRRNDNSDYYQMIAYMYRFACKTGYLIFPYAGEKDIELKEKAILEGFDDHKGGESKIVILGLKIPQATEITSFHTFQTEMGDSEKKLKEIF